MTYKIFPKILALSVAIAISSCDNESVDKSVITSFAKYPVALAEGTPVVAAEADENTYTFKFKLDGVKQVNPVTLNVEVGSNSTATEDVDFELSAHEFSFDAFEGQDGFSLDITVLQDFEIEEGDAETIYLTFTTSGPSGVDNSQTLLVTINDSGLAPQPGETADFALSWDFANPALETEDICDYTGDLDLDVTFQTAGTDPYDDDLMGFAASTGVCVEHGTVALEDMVDGEVYDVWVFIYGNVDYGDLSALTVTLDYERANTTFAGSLVVEDVFDTRMADDGFKIGTIQRSGDVLILKDGGGTVVGQGRAGIKEIHGVKKPNF